MVLVKSVLEVILVYWMLLAWIPKGILEKSQEDLFQIPLGRIAGLTCIFVGKLESVGV